jgi:hypothetical protein
MWKCKKFGMRLYKGCYQRIGRFRLRELVLTATLRNGRKDRVIFKSAEQAKAAGWKKVG